MNSKLKSQRSKLQLKVQNFRNRGTQQGYIALVTVLIISVVVLTIATTVALLSIGEEQSSFALYKGEENLQFVEGCMEDAMIQIADSPTYSGGTLTQPEGACTITTSKSGNDWTVTATSVSTAYKRTIETQFTRTGSGLTMSSWKEI